MPKIKVSLQGTAVIFMEGRLRLQFDMSTSKAGRNCDLLSCCYDQLQDQKQLIEEFPEGHKPVMAGDMAADRHGSWH